jgi:cell division transport system permease protein
MISAIFAMIIIQAMIYFGEHSMPGIISAHDYQILGIVFAGIMISGICINWLSTFFSVNKYLKMNIDRLYF